MSAKRAKRKIDWATFFSARNDRRAETSDAESGAPVAAHVFSGSLMIVLAIIAFIVLLSWGSIHTFFVQNAEINQVQTNISQLEQKNADLNNQLKLWKDDNYVKQQAKSRLFYVQAGETPYMVTGLDYSSSLADGTSAVALTAPDETWTETLWGSFQESAQEGQSSSGTSNPSVSPSTDASTGASQNPASTASPIATKG